MFALFYSCNTKAAAIREQLLQALLPALLMNIFFVISMATYCTFIAQYYEMRFAESFWSTLLYATGLIATIYIGKYFILNIAGWIFGISNVADTYIFIVLLINKMLGIFLLPILILLAFPTGWLVACSSLQFLMF